MHQYMTAIGFTDIESRKDLHTILDEAEEAPNYHELLLRERDLDFCEYRKEYAPGMGIAIFGDMDTNECFKKQYYFPYFIGSGITSYAEVTMERRMDRDSYVGICEDTKLEINLIFQLQNTLDYLREQSRSKEPVICKSVTLAGLCNEGMILLPLMKSKQQEKEQKQESHDRSILMSAAKAGDPEAMESLTMNDIDTYTRVSRRLVSEDVFSIVDTYIMPCGIECDQYSILGTILDIGQVVNDYTEEPVYILRLDVNELQFDVCVPANRIVGEPEVGRRFKGDIWLQGWAKF